MERKERVYISGPISGHDKEERRRAFKEIQLRLEKLGLEVFNPLENGIPAEATTQRHMHRDLATLTREENPFDLVYMMRGWLHSAGCKLEFDVATAIGMDVHFEEAGITFYNEEKHPAKGVVG